MTGYSDERVPTSGLLGHSLKLALGVILSGLVVVFLIDNRDLGETLAPPRDSAPARDAAGGGPVSELVLRAGRHGHFMVDAEVDGTTVKFLVDTGASSIFLTPDDAASLGWPRQRLTFSERYDTANGEIRAAPVTLRSIRIGQLEFYDLPASVGEAPGGVSLLGMTFLRRFESYQVRGDRLILSW
jgi:aspartyl protease family protein